MEKHKNVPRFGGLLQFLAHSPPPELPTTSQSLPQPPRAPPSFPQPFRAASFFFLGLAMPRDRKCCLEKPSRTETARLPEQTPCTVKETEDRNCRRPCVRTVQGETTRSKGFITSRSDGNDQLQQPRRPQRSDEGAEAAAALDEAAAANSCARPRVQYCSNAPANNHIKCHFGGTLLYLRAGDEQSGVKPLQHLAQPSVLKAPVAIKQIDAEVAQRSTASWLSARRSRRRRAKRKCSDVDDDGPSAGINA